MHSIPLRAATHARRFLRALALSSVLPLIVPGGLASPAAASPGGCPPSDHACSETGGPGCLDVACCEKVCAFDPFCCAAAWDLACVDEAAAFCKPSDPCTTADHDCHTPGGPGCMDVDCCNSVCAVDPSCCATQWDGTCVDLVAEHCPSSNCCIPNGGLGCDDTKCEASVCAADSSCCDVAWDDACAIMATDLCHICGHFVLGPCCVAYGGLGCDDAACEENVCAANPFCCEMGWDGLCAYLAAILCPDHCGDADPVSNCCVPNGALGCDDPACEASVCAADSFCCDVAWDGTCAGEAADLCPDVCGNGGPSTCCVPTNKPGCDDSVCESSVCAADQFCCEVAWDGTCAGEAVALCGALCSGGCTSPPPGMVAWWTFDETAGSTAHDVVGGHHGTLKNDAMFAPGYVQNALFVDGGLLGTFDHVRVPNSSALNFGYGDFSVDAWVLFQFQLNPPYPSGRTILHKPGAYRVMANPLELHLHLGSSEPPYFPGGQNCEMPVDKWHHIAATVFHPTPGSAAAIISYYLNGALCGTKAVPASHNMFASSVNDLAIGARLLGSQGAESWPGFIDEVELFDRVLSESEIKAIYDAGVFGKCKSGPYEPFTPCCPDPACPPVFLRSGQHNGDRGMPGQIDDHVLWGADISTKRCTTNSIADGNGMLPFEFCSIPTNIVAPHPAWKPSLDCDPSARWINSTIQDGDGIGYPGQSALYCHPFYLGCGEDFESACITFCWMADDRLGDDPIGGPADVGVYLDNGSTITEIPAIFGGHFSFETTVTAAIPPYAINPVGLNRLFVYQRNHGCAASGLIYSARIDLCRSCVSPPSGMVAWWPLDETTGPVADDATANGNHGQWQDDPTPVPGVVDGALHFDGVDDSVFVPANPDLVSQGGDFTVDAWIRWEQSDIPFPTIVTSTSVSPNNWYRLMLQANVTNPPLSENLQFWINSGSDSLMLHASQVVPTAEWVHVAATLQQPFPGGGVCTLYVNGWPVDTASSLPTFVINPTGTTRIGSRFPPGSGANQMFQGDIDEVELFCRALSQPEIHAIWQAGVLGKCKESCWATSNRSVCAEPGMIPDAAQASIVNRSTSTQTYSYTITQTAGCAVSGMAYVPSTGMITVDPGQTGVVDFDVNGSGASGFGQACFQVAFLNQSTGNQCWAFGNVYYNDCGKGKGKGCCDATSVSVELPVGGTGIGSFELAAGPQGADLDYQVIAVPLDASMYDTPLSLGGLPPGEPIVGSLSVGPFEDFDIDINVNWPWCGWFAIGFEVQLLVAPAGSGGPFQVLSSFMVTMADETGCPADLARNGEVGGADLGILLGSFGGPGAGDFDGNGVVDGGDLGLLLGAWGPCP